MHPLLSGSERESMHRSSVAIAIAASSWLPLWFACHGHTSVIAHTDAASDAGAEDGPSSPPEASDSSVDENQSPDTGTDAVSEQVEATTVYNRDAAPAGSFCSLPGSVVWTAQGPMVVPGGSTSAPDLMWLKVPTGFCTHYFATVKTARQLKFAPGGDLFAASPTRGTTGGAGDGIAGIVILPDDDHDGNADANIPFLPGQLQAVQGLMFANGYFYYQNDTKVMRVAYQAGDRPPSSAGELVTDMMSSAPQAFEHWPRVFDQTSDGGIYITNGGSQSDQCNAAWPVRGGVFKLNADSTTSLVSMGFRNPIAMRCESNHDVCLVAELALDYSWNMAGREKVVPVRQGDNWGYPCCATHNVPYTGVNYSGTTTVPDCAGVAQDTDSFVIGHTPFGLDFEGGKWPTPWNGRVFVTLHGDAGAWTGARIVAIALDSSGMPMPATELDGGGADPNNMLEFATGWDDGTRTHGRPAPVAFAPDGRMFIGDDQRGAVIWIAPVGLMH
jgi:glucose/arabinose dehydrogenase